MAHFAVLPQQSMKVPAGTSTEVGTALCHGVNRDGKERREGSLQ